MGLIKITPLHLLGNDERGSTYDFKIRESRDFVLIKRKTGSLSGNTYHEGKNSGTNPKTFVLLNGSIKFLYRRIGERNYYMELIEEAAIIEVLPFVTHSVEALTDIIMLECNSIDDIQEDRHREHVVQKHSKLFV